MGEGGDQTWHAGPSMDLPLEVECDTRWYSFFHISDPDDYDEENETLIFGPDQTRQCVNITVEDDGLLEGLETLDVILLNNPSFIVLDPDRAVIRVIDDDGEMKLHYMIIPQTSTLAVAQLVTKIPTNYSSFRVSL